jgi:copper chaperone CopZ
MSIRSKKYFGLGVTLTGIFIGFLGLVTGKEPGLSVLLSLTLGVIGFVLYATAVKNQAQQTPQEIKAPPTGSVLLLWGITLQTLMWLLYYAPFYPLTPMSLYFPFHPLAPSIIPFHNSLFLHGVPLLVGIVGLFFNAQTRGRHPAWSVLGIVPVFGPIGGLIALNVRLKPSVLSPDPSLTVSAIRFQSFTRSLVTFMLWFSIVLWIVSVGFWTVLMAKPITSISPNSSFRVYADCCGIYVQRIVGRIFLTDQAASIKHVQKVKRIVWSKDGIRFFAIGARSDCAPGIKLPDDHAYALAMYDGTFHSLCAGPYAKLPDLRKYEWHDFSFPEPIDPALLDAANQKITLVLGGKMCDLYRPSVETALKKVPGVTALDFKSIKGSVVVTADASVKLGKLEDAVNGVKGEGWYCEAKIK